MPAADVLPHAHEHHPPLWVEVTGIALPLIGIFIGYQVFLKGRWQGLRMANAEGLRNFLASGWGFDWLYDSLLVKPFLRMAKANRNDIVDLIPKGVVLASSQCYYFFSRGQNGQLRFYVATMAAAAILIISLALFT